MSSPGRTAGQQGGRGGRASRGVGWTKDEPPIRAACPPPTGRNTFKSETRRTDELRILSGELSRPARTVLSPAPLTFPESGGAARPPANLPGAASAPALCRLRGGTPRLGRPDSGAGRPPGAESGQDRRSHTPPHSTAEEGRAGGSKRLPQISLRSRSAGATLFFPLWSFISLG